MGLNPALIPVQAMTLMTALVHVKGRKCRNGGNALAHAVAVAALIAVTQTLIGAERGDIAQGTPIQITRGRALLSTGAGTEGRVGMRANIEKEVSMMTGEMMRRKWEVKEVIPRRKKRVKKKGIRERRRKCIGTSIGTSIGIGAVSDQGFATEYDPVISEKTHTLRKTETEAKKRSSDVKQQGVEKGIWRALLLHPPLHLHLHLLFLLFLLLPLHISLLETKSVKPPPKNLLYHQHHHH